MNAKRTGYLVFAVVFLLWTVGLVSVGCAGRPTAQATPQTGYASALTTDYENALDVPTQLALGTIKLEGSENAVTSEQAAILLPLWRSLQSNTVKNDTERNAVFKQIEKLMTQAQLATIRAMQLTSKDLADLAPGGGAFPQGMRPEGMARPDGGTSRAPRQGQGSGQGFDPSLMTTRRAQMENMSEEERRQLLSRFQGGFQGNNAAAAGSDMVLNMVIANLIRLLAERSGQQVSPPVEPPVRPEETPSATAEPATSEPTPTPTALLQQSTATAQPVAVELTATPAPTGLPTANEPAVTPTTIEPAATPTATFTRSTATTPKPTATAQATATPLPGLIRIADPNPGPPLTVSISLNQVEPDPLVETANIYRVSGLVHNDSTETYDLSAVHVTFYDAGGFRGSYIKFPGRNTGGEWVWQGATEADFACLLLAPGQSCPFMVEIRAQNMASFMVHPDATATAREPVSVQLSDVRVIQDDTGFVRLTGKATNVGTVAAKNITVIGMLLDADGCIVSIGSTVVLQEDVAPGTTVNFDLRVAKTVYATYRLVGQAERDWQ